MNKYKLVLADTSIEYIELFKKFVRETEYKERLIIKSFTNKDKLYKYLDEEHIIDILLIDPKMMIEGIEKYFIEKIVHLKESNTNTPTETETFPSMFKYQPLDQLLSQILSNYHRIAQEMSNRHTKVITIFSSTEGVGKTTFSLNIAKQLALREFKVFYLNLEVVSTTNLFFSPQDTSSFSKVIFHLKANPSQLKSKINELKQYDTITRIDYFPSPIYPTELLELSAEDIERLITVLQDDDYYDYLIIDLDSAFFEKAKACFQLSDKIYWLLTDDLQYLHKTYVLHKFITNNLQNIQREMLFKTKFILNKAIEQKMDNPLNSPFVIYSYIPYIPKWKNVSYIENYFNEDEYNLEITRIISSFEQ